MRIWLLILIVLTPIITTTGDPEIPISSLNEVLQTDHYIIVAQQDDNRYLETNVTWGDCPEVVTHPRSERMYFRYAGIHLMRDISGSSPPKVLTVSEDEKLLSVQYFSLNASKALGTKNRKVLDYKNDRKYIHYQQAFGVFGKNNKNNIVNTVFDTTSSMLYFDYSTPSFYYIEQYYVIKAFSEKPELQMIKKFSGSTSKYRYDLVEDPYTEKFYYKEDVANQTLYFEAKIKDVVDIVSGEITGKQIFNIPKYEKILGVSKGAFYGLRAADRFDTHQNFTFIASSMPNLQLNCEIAVERMYMPESNKMFIVRDHDYCMLRDGINYNKDQCDEEQKRYNTVIIEEEFNFVLWLTAACVILFAIVILLGIYIYWLRSSFVTGDEQNLPNEYETEASLFIAKQRSFPTSYQDPALLDVSVDRWN